MQAQQFLSSLIEKLDCSNNVKVRILTRDEDGNVIHEKIAPVSYISGIYERDLMINIEISKIRDITD